MSRTIIYFLGTRVIFISIVTSISLGIPALVVFLTVFIFFANVVVISITPLMSVLRCFRWCGPEEESDSESPNIVSCLN